MSALVTDATVLHAFDYRETSRIVRLATREAGVQSVIARGARRPKSRFGPALDLFAEGAAQIALHRTGDLHTLTMFDVTHAHTGLATTWNHFAAASALGEMMLRFGGGDANPSLYDVFARALGAVESSAESPGAEALGAAWAMVAELGFAPSLDACALCGKPIARDAAARFAHRAGGALCAMCAVREPRTRALPIDAREAIATWIGGGEGGTLDARNVRAHVRLLREFLDEHLTDHRPLRAFAVWERGEWLPR